MAKIETPQGYAIPPNREAVAAALKSPKHRPSRALKVFILFLVGGLGIYLLPKIDKLVGESRKPPIMSTMDPVYGEARKYPNTFQLLVDLPASHEGGHQVELGGDLVFSYAADYDDFDAADASIDAHWDQAARLMLRMVAEHTRREHIRDRVQIFDKLRSALTGALFPGHEGRVVQLEWQELRLH